MTTAQYRLRDEPLDDEERYARVALARLVEPGHRGLHTAVGAFGAVAARRATKDTRQNNLGFRV